MSVRSEFYHSVVFGEKNTWDDWHLVPSSRPVINPPEVKTKYVDVPGGNGILDYTEALTGYPLFENRTGSLEFYVMNGYQEWYELYGEICDYLHGEYMQMYLEDDPDWYFEGRFTVNEWKSSKDWSMITIDYDLYPYKKRIVTSLDDWLWDPFNFEKDYVHSYKDIKIAGTTTVNLVNAKMPVVPIFHVKSSDGLGFIYSQNGDRTRTISNIRMTDGEFQNPNIVIKGGMTRMTFVGYGTVSIEYREGRI